MYKHIRIQKCMLVVYVSVFAYLYMHIYIYMYLCMYIHQDLHHSHTPPSCPTHGLSAVQHEGHAHGRLSWYGVTLRAVTSLMRCHMVRCRVAHELSLYSFWTAALRECGLWVNYIPLGPYITRFISRQFNIRGEGGEGWEGWRGVNGGDGGWWGGLVFTYFGLLQGVAGVGRDPGREEPGHVRLESGVWSSVPLVGADSFLLTCVHDRICTFMCI